MKKIVCTMGSLALSGAIAFSALGSDSTPNVFDVVSKYPTGTSWQDVSASDKQYLMDEANDLHQAYDAEFGYEGLSQKLTIFKDFPTATMMESFDAYLGKQFEHLMVDPKFTFSTGIQNPDLLDILKGYYIARQGIDRADNYAYFDYADSDWNGRPFSGELSYPLPSVELIEGQKKFVKEFAQQFAAIDVAALTPFEKSLMDELVIVSRQLGTGTFNGVPSGSDFFLSPWGQGSWTVDFLSRYLSETATYFNFHELMNVTNAYFFSDMKWINSTQVKLYEDYYLDIPYVEDKLIGGFGDIQSNEIARAWRLMLDWKLERMKAHPDANKACTIFTADEQDEMWKSFTAVMLTPESEMGTMAEYQNVVLNWGLNESSKFTLDVMDGVRQMVGSELTMDQYNSFLSAMPEGTPFGKVLDVTYETLDSVTGSSVASDALEGKLDSIQSMGGGYAEEGMEVTAADKQAWDNLWTEVRNWLIKRYEGFPIDAAQAIPETINLKTEGGTYTTIDSEIFFNIFDTNSVANISALMIHEALHAVQFHVQDINGQRVTGASLEGQAELAGRMLVEAFLTDYLTSTGSLGELDYQMIDYDQWSLRLLSRTDGTIKVITRDSCEAGELDSYEYIKQNALNWGRSEEQAITDVTRSHNGTQYLQYVYGILYVENQLNFVTGGLSHTAGYQIEPFMVSMCALPVISSTTDYVDSLQSCISTLP